MELNWHSLINTVDGEVTIYPSGSVELSNSESCWFNDIDDAIDALKDAIVFLESEREKRNEHSTES